MRAARFVAQLGFSHEILVGVVDKLNPRERYTLHIRCNLTMSADEIDRTNTFPRDLWPKIGALGLHGELLDGSPYSGIRFIDRFTVKDGRLVDISLTISPVRNSEGKIIGASKIARDITERKRTEERQDLIVEASRRNAEVMRAMGMAEGVGRMFARTNATHLSAQQQAGDITGGLSVVSRVLRMMLQSGVPFSSTIVPVPDCTACIRSPSDCAVER